MGEANRPPGLPASMALAWGVTERPARGPRRGLTLDRIVSAGIEIAVADGIGAVSMGRVATAVGVSTMALYRYVAAKDDLLELMVDTALGSPPPAQPGETWREGLYRWAVGVRDAYRANPWTMRVPISAPPLGPNNVRWLENALASTGSTGLSAAQRVSCVLLIAGFVRAEELLVADTRAGQQAGESPDHYALALAALVDEREFPNIVAMLAAGEMADDEGIDHEFDFGIERILDGIAALMSPAHRRRRAT
jgi:AcrR family transcriptional regulator